MRPPKPIGGSGVLRCRRVLEGVWAWVSVRLRVIGIIAAEMGQRWA